MLRILWIVVVALVLQTGGTQTPDQFFGFHIGADGELARYPKIVEYLRHLSKTTTRVKFEELGKTTMGNPYVLATISAPENLAKLTRLVEINRRLADPRGLTEAEAKRLAQEGRAFYFIYGTIHSTEVGNTQSLVEIAHRLATDTSPEIKQILDNVVVLLVPSQNPDGQYLVIDHWYKTKGTPFTRTYPDLYHKYVGHDDNRDWFMFTQKETRLAVEIQNTYKPIITHDMHQQGSGGSRIFLPPFDDPYDPNVHPIIAQGIMSVGQAMASALVAEGKGGAEWLSRYDLWAPARQYMVYHGQPRILSEIASVNLADPLVNADGSPIGPQESRWNFPMPYRKSTWRLRDIVDYGDTVAYAGMAHVAKYRTAWLENFYRIHADWVNRTDPPYAFVVPAAQRDPFETFEMLDILRIGEVEIHQATAPFKAGGKDYGAGSWVVKTAQPYGAFAKTLLERQKYPDLRLYPGGPPKPPYDVTGHTLWMLMGVEVDQIEKPFGAALELVKAPRPAVSAFPAIAQGMYLVDPSSNAGFIAVAKLQAAKVPIYRAVDSGTVAAGTWIVPVSAESGRILARRRAADDRRRLPPQARDAHRAVARRERDARRLAEMGVRAVRLQPQGDRLDRLRERSRVAIRHHRAAGRHEPRDDRQRAQPRTQRQGMGVGVRRRRWRLEEARRVGARRRHARRHRIGGRHGAAVAGSADRAVAAGASRRGRTRWWPGRPGCRTGARRPGAGRHSRVARRILQPRVARRDAPRARHRSDDAVLLPGVAAPERAQHGASRGVRHAGVLAGVLPRGSGVPAETGIHDPERGRVAVSHAGPDSPERLAAR